MKIRVLEFLGGASSMEITALVVCVAALSKELPALAVLGGAARRISLS